MFWQIYEINSIKCPKCTVYRLERFSTKQKSAQIEKIKFPVPWALVTFIGEGHKFSLPLEKNKNFP